MAQTLDLSIPNTFAPPPGPGAGGSPSSRRDLGPHVEASIAASRPGAPHKRTPLEAGLDSFADSLHPNFPPRSQLRALQAGTPDAPIDRILDAAPMPSPHDAMNGDPNSQKPGFQAILGGSWTFATGPKGVESVSDPKWSLDVGPTGSRGQILNAVQGAVRDAAVQGIQNARTQDQYIETRPDSDLPQMPAARPDLPVQHGHPQGHPPQAQASKGHPGQAVPKHKSMQMAFGPQGPGPM